ncbi:MAG: hypothetical protein ACD_46C00323G0001, partial [uncultured bacterium]
MRWTTKEVLLLEKDILNLIIDGKQKVRSEERRVG